MMTLDSIHMVEAGDPPRITILGPAGIGKTTLAAEFHRTNGEGTVQPAIFLQTESGTPGGLKLHSFGALSSFAAVIEAIGVLYSQEHDFSTVVLDSLSALQVVVFAEVCRRENKASIEAVPYGRGYGRAVEILSEIVEGLDALRSHRGMAVVLVGHTVIRKFDDPLGASFDQYQLDMHQRLAGFVMRWSDVVLFVDAPAIVRTEGSGFNQRRRAEGGSIRLIHTNYAHGYAAKSRYPMPASIRFEKGRGFAALAPFLPGFAENPTPNSKENAS